MDMNRLNNYAATGERLNTGRTKVFALWRSGELGSILIGGRRFSTDKQIDEYIARLEAGATTEPQDAA